jgi:hypothetical protein
MSTRVEEFEPWSRVRWASAIGIAVVVQLALVLAFTQRPVGGPRPVDDAQVILPEQVARDLQQLTDPTLFALGGPRNSSATWLELPQLPPVKTDWEQPVQWLGPEPGALGRAFLEFARANASYLQGPAFKTAPKAALPKSLANPKPVRTASQLIVLDDLQGRRLLNAPELPSWTAGDVLLPSNVRVVVDARGRVTSAILLSPGSGSAEADRFAVAQAWQLRFSPVPPGPETQPLTLGRLAFTWHTTPQAGHPTDDR